MYELTTVDDVAILHLDGELNHGEIVQIKTLLKKLMGSQKHKVVLNFDQVEHINYKTIQLLLDQASQLRSRQGDLKCASMNHYTQNIFRFTGAAQTMESYDSVYDAVMSFHGESEKHRTWH